MCAYLPIIASHVGIGNYLSKNGAYSTGLPVCDITSIRELECAAKFNEKGGPVGWSRQRNEFRDLENSLAAATSVAREDWACRNGFQLSNCGFEYSRRRGGWRKRMRVNSVINGNAIRVCQREGIYFMLKHWSIRGRQRRKREPTVTGSEMTG